MKLSKKGISLIIVLLIAVIGGGFWYVNGESFKRSMAIGTVSPPKQLTKADFPSHNINITKYFQPVEFKYDPNVKVYRGFDDIGYIEHETNPYVIDAGEYAHGYALSRIGKLCDEGKIPKIICGRGSTEINKCLMEADKKYDRGGEVWNKICRTERIEGYCGQKCIDKIKEKKEKGERLDFLEGEDLEYYIKDKKTIYNSCELPEEVKYQLFVKRHDEKNKCVDKILSRYQK